MQRTRILICCVLILLAYLFVMAIRRGPSDSEPGYLTRTEHIMACPITVRVPTEHADAAEAVFDIFRAVDERMSEWKQTSPLSAVNAAAGARAVEVPDDLRTVVRRAVEIGDLTGGAFDVTWAALWGLWDFRTENPRVPDEVEIAARVSLVNYRAVEIDDTAGTVRLREPDMVIGLGAIAKGHALDEAAAMLRARGVESFLISAAGQMMVGGSKGDRPWRIGIRDPRGAEDDYFAYLDVRDTSVSTSGDYERAFMLDGVRYHHILDPRTGRPARGVRSATVIGDDATLVDGLSTAVLVMGVEAGVALVEDLHGVETVIVDRDAAVHTSSGLGDRLVVRHAPNRD